MNWISKIWGGSTTAPDESRAGFSEIPGETPDSPETFNDSSEPVGNQTSNTTLFANLVNHDKSDIVITPENAMGLSAVYSCIDRIASNIAMMPACVIQKKGGKRSVVESHDANYLLSKSPNDWQSPFLFKQSLIASALGWGNGCFSIERGRMGSIHGFNSFITKNVQLVNLRKGRWIYICITDEGEAIDVFPDDMFHLRALGSKHRWGISPIKQHADLMRMGLSAQKYAKSFFGSGGKPSGIVGVKGENVGKDQLETVKENWRQAASQSGENRIVFLPADVTYNATTISPIDAKLVELLGISRSEIGGIYNVPGYMIGDTKNAGGTSSQQSASFVQNTLQPWVTAFEDELNIKLFTRSELESGICVNLDMDVLLRGTPIERAQRNHYAITDGWLNRNTVREEEGYERVEDQGLDDYMISVNAVKPGGNENDAIGQGKDIIDPVPEPKDKVNPDE